MRRTQRRSSERQTWVLLVGIGLGLLFVVILVIWWLASPRFSEVSIEDVAAEDGNAAGLETWRRYETITEEKDQTRSVEFFLFDSTVDTWVSRGLSVEIPEHESGRVRSIVGEWVRLGMEGGQPSLVPLGTRLLAAYVEAESRVTLDFSEELRSNFHGGITMEVEFLTGLAKTLRANFPMFSEVQILIEGEPTDALGGGLDVSSPLLLEPFAERN